MIEGCRLRRPPCEPVCLLSSALDSSPPRSPGSAQGEDGAEAARRLSHALSTIRIEWIRGDREVTELLVSGLEAETEGYEKLVRGPRGPMEWPRWGCRPRCGYVELMAGLGASGSLAADDAIRTAIDRLLHVARFELVPIALPHCDPSLRERVLRLLRLLDLDEAAPDREGEVAERWRQVWPATGLDGELTEVVALLRAAAAIRGTDRKDAMDRAGPAMDAGEATVLMQLGERELWGIDELPAEIDIDLLRCLDESELIEVRYVVMQNRQPHPVPAPSSWFSPMRQPRLAGTWEKILEKCKRDKWSHPPELHVSERGRACLARLRRQAGSPAGGGGGGSDERWRDILYSAKDATRASGFGGSRSGDPGGENRTRALKRFLKANSLDAADVSEKAHRWRAGDLCDLLTKTGQTEQARRLNEHARKRSEAAERADT